MSDLKELSNLQKYNGKEYNLWKFQAQAYLDGRGFMGIVDGTEIIPVLPSVQSSIQFLRSSLGVLYSQSLLRLLMKGCLLHKGMKFRMPFLTSRKGISKFFLFSFSWLTNQSFTRSLTAKLPRKSGINSLSFINALLCNHCISYKRTITTCGLGTMAMWPPSLEILKCSTVKSKNSAPDPSMRKWLFLKC
jgi:hypothetical protein